MLGLFPTLMPLLIFIVFFALIGATWFYFYVQRICRHQDEKLRHQLQTLSESVCPACGKHYGEAAAERARAETIARRQEILRQAKATITFARYWEIHCAQCGAEAKFYYETESLVAHPA